LFTPASCERYLLASKMRAGTGRWRPVSVLTFCTPVKCTSSATLPAVESSDAELTNSTNGGTLTVVGTTTSPASSVTVNSTSASLYGDATFAAAGLPLTTTYTATASDSYGRHSTNAVTVSLSTNVTFQYDGNGNLTNDGLRNFVYDDENELVQASVSNAWMSQFSYDAKMRRRVRKEFAWQNSAWTQTNQVYYVYDGNLVIQERDVNNLPTTTYTRGSDLSGSLQGAGGIGGLLARTSQQYSDASLSGQAYYHSDANGNVTMLIDDKQGIVAKYLYDAFGNTLSASGLLGNANVYRFSSKEWHVNSGMAYYLYRYYDPNLQRWPNRDPIGEAGGLNLYAFVQNDGLNAFDPFGLSQATISVRTVIKPPFFYHHIDVAGVKTMQIVTVDDAGRILPNPKDYIAPTYIGHHPYPGSGSLMQNAWAAGPNIVTVNLSGTAATYFDALLSGDSIKYSYTIQLNFCTHKGTAVGRNEQFPSYFLSVNGGQIYQWLQKGGLNGLEQQAQTVNVSFSF
jgi:RHS repeat-associated protein